MIKTLHYIDGGTTPGEVQDEIRDLWATYEHGNGDYHYFDLHGEYNGCVKNQYPLLAEYITKAKVEAGLVEEETVAITWDW